MSKLVSVITPCFNGELFVGRYIESILAQTYRPIELFLVDDGSTDGTASIVQGYKDRLESNNIKWHYIFQENAGQAAALNRGLPLFKGDHLIWVDSDDYLFPHSISKRVVFLEEHPEFGLVRSDGVKSDEKAPYKPIWCISNKSRNRFNTAIFEDVLLYGTFITPVCYMVRRSAFLDTHPSRAIYPHRVGQNYQMLLPVTFKYECGYIDEPLCAHVMRADSHSRTSTGNSLDKNLERIEGCEEIITHVLKEMGGDALTYLSWVKLKYARQRLALAYLHENPDLANQNYREMKKHRSPTLQERWWYWGSKSRLTHAVIETLARPFSIPMRTYKKIRALAYARTKRCHAGLPNTRAGYNLP